MIFTRSSSHYFFVLFNKNDNATPSSVVTPTFWGKPSGNTKHGTDSKPTGQTFNFKLPDTDWKQSKMFCVVFQAVNLSVQ